MKFVEVTKQDLSSMKPTLEILGQLNDDTLVGYTVLGVTSSPKILASAQEVVNQEYTSGFFPDDEEDEEEGRVKVEPPTLESIAIAIPFSTDFLHYFLGSGLIIHGLTFSYFTTEEGARTDIFHGSDKTKITDEDFTILALSDSDVWLDDFLAENRTLARARVQTQLPDAIDGEEKESEPTAPEPVSEPGHKASSARRDPFFQGVDEWFQ